MDRSKIKRIAFTFFIFLLFLSSAKAAPNHDEKINASFSGILYGYVHDLRPDFSAITVKPTEASDKRHRIIVDSKTQVFINKKRKNAKSLYLGDKVAVRYFGRGTTIIADAIYVVFGEFVPKDYVIKKRLNVIKKETDGKGKEGKGHGEEKKDAKPKGH